MLELPRPRELLQVMGEYTIVIASVWQRDYRDKSMPKDAPAYLAVVILLNKRPPYYTIMQLWANENYKEWIQGSRVEVMNINEATYMYSQWGGDI